MDPRLKYDLVFRDFEGCFGLNSRIKSDYLNVKNKIVCESTIVP